LEAWTKKLLGDEKQKLRCALNLRRIKHDLLRQVKVFLEKKIKKKLFEPFPSVADAATLGDSFVLLFYEQPLSRSD
jgi:hypothetical protein